MTADDGVPKGQEASTMNSSPPDAILSLREDEIITSISESGKENSMGDEVVMRQDCSAVDDKDARDHENGDDDDDDALAQLMMAFQEERQDDVDRDHANTNNNNNPADMTFQDNGNNNNIVVADADAHLPINILPPQPQQQQQRYSIIYTLFSSFRLSLRYIPLSFLSAFLLLHHTLRTRQQFYLAMTYLSTSKLSYIILGNAIIAFYVKIFTLVTQLFLEGGLRPNERDSISEQMRWDITETCLALTMFRSELDVGTAIKFLTLVVLKG